MQLLTGRTCPGPDCNFLLAMHLIADLLSSLDVSSRVVGSVRFLCHFLAVLSRLSRSSFAEKLRLAVQL